MKTLVNITLYAISKGILGALEPLIISDSLKYLGAQSADLSLSQSS